MPLFSGNSEHNPRANPRVSDCYLQVTVTVFDRVTRVNIHVAPITGGNSIFVIASGLLVDSRRFCQYSKNRASTAENQAVSRYPTSIQNTNSPIQGDMQAQSNSSSYVPMLMYAILSGHGNQAHEQTTQGPRKPRYASIATGSYFPRRLSQLRRLIRMMSTSRHAHLVMCAD